MVLQGALKNFGTRINYHTRTQVRWRRWLYPHPTNGWNANSFEHVGLAVEFARCAKRLRRHELADVCGFSEDFVKKIELGIVTPDREILDTLTVYLGVPFYRQAREKDALKRSLLK